ncbi:RlpA-like double-psi beta-barrel-protein domain-containing protein-containing protein, partial [Infundibulicybe gibba]
LGACGHENTASDLIVALNAPQYGNGGNCGRNVRITYKGKSVVAKIVDKCPGCKSGDLDLSPAAFDRLANQSVGRIKVDWVFV